MNEKVDKNSEVAASASETSQKKYAIASDDGNSVSMQVNDAASAMRYNPSGSKMIVTVESSSTEIPSIVYEDTDGKWHNLFGSYDKKEFDSADIMNLYVNEMSDAREASVHTVVSSLWVEAGRKAGTDAGYASTA